jgi:hypothetical protein
VTTTRSGTWRSFGGFPENQAATLLAGGSTATSCTSARSLFDTNVLVYTD